MANHQDETRAAYDGVVELYASLFADRLETQPFARAMIGTFAELVRATGNLRAADVGCGPGHLTAMLHELGLNALGLDLSPGMVDHAQRAHPALHFQEARMESLPIEDGALGGVLAHYSMIHTPPEELPELLAEQGRVLAPDGLLLVSTIRPPNGAFSTPTAYPPLVGPARQYLPDVGAPPDCQLGGRALIRRELSDTA
ncbi:class I SAM-dependent methyltransferase [Streptomyces boninensis]|uniref:class I SAM-dependent methyltransferase n=1 Tax=Streptomyces boninensis TaxID=2039455 RepID=UPI003B22384C